METTSLDKSESAILARGLATETGDLRPELAEYVLTLGLTEAGQLAAKALAKLAESGNLSDEQSNELDNYRRAGRIFELLKSKARLSLRNGGTQTSS